MSATSLTMLSGEEVRRALDGRQLGPHLPLSVGLLKAADRAREIGAGAVQVFTDNPTAWRRRREPPARLLDFRARLADASIAPVAVHAPYLVNLAGADETFWRRSIETLVTDLRAAVGYGARFLNVHIGSHRGLGREVGIARLAAGLRVVLAQAPADAPVLALECSAGSGACIGSTLEELAEILDAIGAAGVDTARVGICLDTAHLWAAGYDLATPAEATRMADRAVALLGDRLGMIHLNDSRAKRGSRIDRHEHIGAGEIGAEGMSALLNHPVVGRLPTYFETPGMDVGYDAVNLERVALLLRGEKLPQLGPEAFALRGSRARSAPIDARVATSVEELGGTAEDV